MPRGQPQLVAAVLLPADAPEPAVHRPPGVVRAPMALAVALALVLVARVAVRPVAAAATQPMALPATAVVRRVGPRAQCGPAVRVLTVEMVAATDAKQKASVPVRRVAPVLPVPVGRLAVVRAAIPALTAANVRIASTVPTQVVRRAIARTVAAVTTGRLVRRVTVIVRSVAVPTARVVPRAGRAAIGSTDRAAVVVRTVVALTVAARIGAARVIATGETVAPRSR